MSQAKILKALKRLEWSGRGREDFGHGDYSFAPCCPSCGAVNWGEYGGYGHMHKGHMPKCELKAVIRFVEDGAYVTA